MPQHDLTLPAPLAPQLARFILVGGLGFGIDLGLTLAGTGPGGLEPARARIIGLAIAISVTFILNRRVTFGSADPALLRQAWRYGIVCLLGSAINFGFYRATLAMLPGAGPSAAALTLAVIIGSAVAMAANFAGMRFFAFAK